MVQVNHIVGKQRQPDYRYNSVGQCIYCRVVPEDGGLTDEHIVPDGMNGHLILPKSSCKACQDHIGKFEFQAMRYSLNLGRARHGIRSKKGIKRGNEKVEASGNGVDYFAISPNMPSLIGVSHYNRPADAITGRFGDDKAANSIGWSEGGVGSPSVKVRPGDMTRFVAKIAHAYSVAVFGIDSFRPFLTEHILGAGDTGIPKFLGITDSLAAHVGSVVELNAYDMVMPIFVLPNMPAVMKHVIIVNIRIFGAEYNLPTYQIVAGELSYWFKVICIRGMKVGN